MLRSILDALGFGPAIETISPRNAHQGRCTGEVVIIDIRDANEWAKTGTPQGSNRVSMTDPDFVRSVTLLVEDNPNAVAAISCATGMRSKTAIKLLRKSGLENLKAVSGGIDRWHADGLPVDL